MLQILIIDDDKNIRRYLKTILLAAGYTPICTETADAPRNRRVYIHKASARL